MQVSFSSSNFGSLIKAAEKIESLTNDEKITLIANVVEHRLMVGRLFNLIFTTILLKKSRAGVEKTISFLMKFQPQIIDSIVKSTKYHLLVGDDLEDTNSVGGFSQRELNLLFRGIE